MNGGIVNWQQANYDKVKNAMRPGDVIVFGGKGSASDLIKAVTQNPVSHVAIVLQSSLPVKDDPSTQPSPQIIEATGQLDPYYGVSVRWLDERITGYQGNMGRVAYRNVGRVISFCARTRGDIHNMHRFCRLKRANGEQRTAEQGMGTL
jgi:hypothetical protein